IPRATISIISRLRTDFSPLNATRFRLHQTDSPACEACGAPETRAHFLLQCSAWKHFRPPLQRASYEAELLGLSTYSLCSPITNSSRPWLPLSLPRVDSL
ncbi:hypothetical protein K438DRAFT_2102480, partial [Mycena galopus ATCC 62051]